MAMNAAAGRSSLIFPLFSDPGFLVGFLNTPVRPDAVVLRQEGGNPAPDAVDLRVEFPGIFGAWKPFRIALAALLFGLFRSLSNVYTGFPFLEQLNLPGTVYNMMPYIISLIVLILFSKNSAAPKAEGIPYDQGSR